MNLFNKEHYEIIEQFEKKYPYIRKDKESKELWKKKSSIKMVKSTSFLSRSALGSLMASSALANEQGRRHCVSGLFFCPLAPAAPLPLPHPPRLRWRREMEEFTMRELTKDEIAILQRHAKWLQSDGEEGERANLSYANLRFANLSYADLSYADLSNTDLSYADLGNANLSNSDLSNARLRNANLRYADLSNARLDFSCWPLWCGSRDVKADDRLVAQLLFHVTRLDVTQCSGGVREAMGHIRTMAVSDLFSEYRNDIEKIGE